MKVLAFYLAVFATVFTTTSVLADDITLEMLNKRDDGAKMVYSAVNLQAAPSRSSVAMRAVYPSSARAVSSGLAGRRQGHARQTTRAGGAAKVMCSSALGGRGWCAAGK